MSHSYGNNYANLGSTPKSTPGKYLVRYAPSVNKKPGVQLCDQPDHKKPQDCDGFLGFINSPTQYGALLSRLVVKNSTTDIEEIHTLQNQFGLHTIATNRYRN